MFQKEIHRNNANFKNGEASGRYSGWKILLSDKINFLQESGLFESYEPHFAMEKCINNKIKDDFVQFFDLYIKVKVINSMAY